MKVALVCPYDWARPGGVQGHVRALARQLQANHVVRVLAPSSSDRVARAAEPDRVARATVARAATRGPDPGYITEIVGRPVQVPYNRSVAPVALSPLAARRTLQALQRFDPHVVHVHEPFAPVISATAAALGPRPVLATFHAWSHSAALYRLSAPLARRIAAGFHTRVAVSPAAQQFAAQALGLPLGVFRVVPNGVDVAAFTGAQPLPDLVEPSRPLLLFVGRLEPRKGLDVAIRAFLRLRASWPRVRLCVVGEGPERQRCQQMVPPSLRPDVLFVGQVDEQDKPRYHASADLFVAPSTGGESFGIVLLEAMAAGLPVVASNLLAHRHVLRDGQQGRLVPAGDAFALADAVGTLLSNPQLGRAMGREGRRTAAGYAWPVVAKRVERLYRDALA